MSNNKQIPTAEEYCNGHLGFEQYPTDTPYFMIEFAKLHVEAALKAASEKATIKYEYEGNTGSEYYSEYVNSSSILNAYHLDNIK
jgi:hypothetical protein